MLMVPDSNQFNHEVSVLLELRKDEDKGKTY